MCTNQSIHLILPFLKIDVHVNLFNLDLARFVFINYNDVGSLMIPVKEGTDDATERRVASNVVSASIVAEIFNTNKLPEPVIITLKHQKVRPKIYFVHLLFC